MKSFSKALIEFTVINNKLFSSIEWGKNPQDVRFGGYQ